MDGTTSDATSREETLIGVIEGDGAPVLASSTLDVGGKQHARAKGQRFVLRLDDDTRVTVIAGVTLVEVLPTSKRSEPWGKLVDDPRAALFSDVAPGDHVDAKLAGWALVPGQRVAVRGEVGDHALEGGGPRETAVARPSSINAWRIAVVDSTDVQARDLLDQAEQAERDKQAALRERDLAAKAAAAAEAAKVTRPLRAQIIALAVLTVVLVVVGTVWWRDIPEVPKGARRVSGDGLWSLLAFGIALHSLMLLLISLVARGPFEVANCNESSATIKPSWGIGMMSGFFLGFGTIITGSFGMSVAFHGINGLAAPVAVCALCAFAFLWWARWRHRHALRLARLILTARVLPTPLVAGQFGRCTGVVAAGEAIPIQRAIAWQRRSYTNQSTHGPNAGQTSRWIEGAPRNSSQPTFIVEVAGSSLEIHTADAEWGAPLTYLPGSFISTRAAIEPGNEVLVLSRPKLEDGTLHARSTGPESLMLFAAPKNARGMLLRLTLGWLIPAGALLSIIVVSLAWVVSVIAS